MNQPQIVLEYPVYVYNQFKNSEKTTSERREVIDKLWELFYKRNLDNELTERWLKEENESKLEFLEEIREDLYKKRLVREDIYERHMRLPGSGFIK
jgi:polyribonucleotide nucleotidyltransferase